MYYTKYRPQKFSELSKPNEAATALSNQVKSKKTVHAYLFVGPRGTGKTTTARILAKALNCQLVDKEGDPCDKCDVCVSVKAGSFIDLIEIDAASNRGIDDIRDLRDKVKLAPSLGKRKVYIIDEVHMLTTEAFNALLKTLEEPPKHVVFVLCTTENQKVPDTIKSRCQVFKFKRAAAGQIVGKLADICKSEKVKVGEDDLRKIAQAALGGFRDAETLLQQVVEGEISVESLVGVGDKSGYVSFVGMLMAREIDGAIRFINKLYDDGIDLYVWTMELIGYLRDLLFISCDAYEGLVDVPEELFARMEEQADRLDSGEVLELLEAFIKAQNEIKSTHIAQLPLEMAIVEVCSSDGNVPVSKEPTGRHPVGPEVERPRGEASQSKQPKLSDIGKKWANVIKASVSHNNSVHAVLRSCRPLKIEDDVILLEVPYKFHKERLETSKNRQVVYSIFQEVFNAKLSFKCIVVDKPASGQKGRETGELTDRNVLVAAGSDDVLKVFDGNLPL